MSGLVYKEISEMSVQGDGGPFMISSSVHGLLRVEKGTIKWVFFSFNNSHKWSMIIFTLHVRDGKDFESFLETGISFK